MDEVQKRRTIRTKQGMGAYERMTREAVAAGLLPEANRAAALQIAAQIARLEARFERAYAADDEAAKAACSVGALEQMGRAEKHLADLKERFFQMTGLDRLHLARTRQLEGRGDAAGEITLDMPGIQPPPLSTEEDPWAGR